MRFLNRFARGELRLTRIEAFSDAVFAIVVTLLVLELKVPELYEPGSASELGQQLLALLPKFLSWLISFIIVCKFWLNHHHILGTPLFYIVPPQSRRVAEAGAASEAPHAAPRYQ